MESLTLNELFGIAFSLFLICISRFTIAKKIIFTSFAHGVGGVAAALGAAGFPGSMLD